MFVMDRSYVDFACLCAIHKQGAFFAVRADQVIALVTYKSKKGYPERLRRVSCFDEERKKRLVFLTNNFDMNSETVVGMNKKRRQVELFFKWIKRHLQVKSFYGTSRDVAKSRIWVGLRIYLLVAVTKNRLNIERALYTLLQTAAVNPFEKKARSTFDRGSS